MNKIRGSRSSISNNVLDDLEAGSILFSFKFGAFLTVGIELEYTLKKRMNQQLPYNLSSFADFFMKG